jgi:hypothetical protein
MQMKPEWIIGMNMPMDGMKKANDYTHSSQAEDSGVGSDGFPVLDPNPSKEELT